MPAIITIPIIPRFAILAVASFLALQVLSTHGFHLVSPHYRTGGISTGTTASYNIRNNVHSLIIPTTVLHQAGEDNDDKPKEEDNNSSEGIDLSLDDRLYKVKLSRFPGIEWGTDLSFSFVYVRALDPSGPASLSGKVEVGDQLCQLQPVAAAGEKPGEPINLLGAPFDYVMTAFATLDKAVQDVELVFFKGTQEELKAVCTGDGASKNVDSVTITVIQNKGSPEEQVKTITAPAGCNVLEVLSNNNINVYQSVTRWTNCKGKQLCGTCIVNITDGSLQTNRKSMDEASTLRENPDSYRLSCVTFAYGDVTIETFPPIEAAQWTR